MSIEEFNELDEVKRITEELTVIRQLIVTQTDALHRLSQAKRDLYEKIGELGEQYKAEPFYKRPFFNEP